MIKYVVTGILWVLIGVGIMSYVSHESQLPNVERNRDLYLRQFENTDDVPQQIRVSHWEQTKGSMLYGAWVFGGALIFGSMIASDAVKKIGS